MLFAYLPVIFSPHASVYVWAYISQLLVFDIIGILIIRALAVKLHLDPWKTLIFYTLAILSIGPIITSRLDIIPAIATLGAVYYFIDGKHKTAFILLAAGTCIKIYPVILVPFFLIYLFLNRQRQNAINGIGCFAAACLIVIIPVLILSPDGLWHSLIYHAERGLQIESTYASVIELIHAAGNLPITIVHNYGSSNLASPLADSMAKASFFIMAPALTAVYWLFYKHTGNRHSDNEMIITYSLLAILVFILTNKVFSPQYLIWLLPFIVLATGRFKNISMLLFIMASLMSIFIYPQHYKSLESNTLYTVAMLVMRNAILVVLAFVTIKNNISDKRHIKTPCSIS
jgi:uncharacterized membrane protein